MEDLENIPFQRAHLETNLNEDDNKGRSMKTKGAFGFTKSRLPKWVTFHPCHLNHFTA